MEDIIKIAQIQCPVTADKDANLRAAAAQIREMAKLDADLVCLPEMFCCPYETPNFPLYADEEGASTDSFLAGIARECGIYLSAGSVPEKEITEEGEKIYNTAYFYDRQGNKIGKHRKVHLFDIDVKGGQRFMESETLTAGDHFTVVDTEFGKIGLCICFDIRFVETIRIMAQQGARLVVVPAAFNSTTGPAHWELSFRAHSVFSQVFLTGTSPSFDESASYHAWGHSILTDPWGRVVEQMDEKTGWILNEVDLSVADEIRKQLPILSARRTDLYCLEETK